LGDLEARSHQKSPSLPTAAGRRRKAGR